jgi:hypothetical protein
MKTSGLKIFPAAVLFIIFCSFVMHPVNVGITDIRQKDDKLNIHFKLFADDFQSCINTNFRQNFDFVNKGIDAKGTDCIKKYILENFKLTVNKSPKELKFVKAYLNGEIFHIEFETTAKGKISSASVKNILLFNDFPEQKNIVNFHLNNDLQLLEFENGSEEYIKEITF